MELVILVAIPSTFLMFFPAPIISILVAIAADMRLCCILLHQLRARTHKSVELWNAIGVVLALVAVVCSNAEPLRRALIYFAAALTTRLVVSWIVYRENDHALVLEHMQRLNDDLRQSLERMNFEQAATLDHLRANGRRLQTLERTYSDQMKSLNDRLRELNTEQKRRLHELDMQREDVQQLIFDRQEELDRLMLRAESVDPIDPIGSPLALNDQIDPIAAIDNREVRRLFDEALEDAQTELDISSPWLSFKVIRPLIPKFNVLLARGVLIKINCSPNVPTDARNKITQKAAKLLRKEFKSCKQFRLAQSEPCEKFFMVDGKIVVDSSFNVLSYCGECGGGSRSDDADLIRARHQKYFSF